MFAKVSILLLVAAVAHSQLISSYSTGGIPVYKSSALHGGLYGANGFGYGANLGRVGGLGALRTSGAIVGTGGLGYGLGGLGYGHGLGIGRSAVIGGYGHGLGIGRSALIGAPAVSTIGVGRVGAVGLGHGLGLAGLGVGARGISVHQAGPVNAAVTTLARTVDYRPVPYTGEAAVVQDIDVPPQESPLRINFQSKSSPLQVTQQHIPAEPGQVQVTQSEDEPHQLVHNVARSVHQQVNEVVQPYRSLTQTVEPVIEQTHTNIAQGEGVRLTGLQSGIIGGTGVLGASGIGIAAPAVSGVGYGVGLGGLGVAKSYGVGLGGYGSVLGSRLAGVYGNGLSNIYGGYGSGLTSGYGSGLIGGYRSGLIGGYGSGLTSGIGSGLIGGYRSYGLGGLGGYGSGIGLSGLSGLSTYGSTARIGGIY